LRRRQYGRVVDGLWPASQGRTARIRACLTRDNADSCDGGSAKAAVLVVVKLVAGNVLAFLSFWLAVQSLARVA
jgi:hypothetical protein